MIAATITPTADAEDTKSYHVSFSAGPRAIVLTTSSMEVADELHYLLKHYIVSATIPDFQNDTHYCGDCGRMLKAHAIMETGFICLKCRRERKTTRLVSLIVGTAILAAVLMMSGCAVKPVGAGDGLYRPGDVVKARMFTNYPQYEGELVTVKDGLGWKWIKGHWYQGNALRVYEVETNDGRRLAAQEFQLKRIGQ